ncbi:MAG: hypothetical protein MI892_08525, partial [Desulfobacterales bacterium]|nr:hypothetical protein [Desulfobacterales bacterium]
PKDVAGISISGLYGGSGVPLDGDMQPVRPCIIWMDRRATKESTWVEEKIGVDRLFEITGNGIDPYFGYTKILWIKNNERDNWVRTQLFWPPHSYVIYKLTGEASTDYTSAGNMGGIYDLRANTWSYELMDAMCIPHHMMPDKLIEPHEIAGTLTKEAARRLGLCEGIPVLGGAVDCLMSTLAAGATKPGQQVAVIGTSINWGVLHNQFPTKRDYITMPYVIDAKDMYYTYGGASTAGALPNWFKNNFSKYIMGEDGTIKEADYEDLNRLAEKIKPGSEGLLVLPYFMGERNPIWDPEARGTITGLTLHHTKAHVYRAFLESVAFSLRHIIESFDMSPDHSAELFLIGGVTKSEVWKQIFADVCGIPIKTSKDHIQAPLADAFLAGVASGYIEDYSVIGKWVDFSDTMYPNDENHEIYSGYFEEYKKLYASLKDNMKRMASLAKE